MSLALALALALAQTQAQTQAQTLAQTLALTLSRRGQRRIGRADVSRGLGSHRTRRRRRCICRERGRRVR
jgi:hypothetical protein